MSDWYSLVKSAKKEAINQGNLKKVHYEFGNGKEMVEEYNMDTNVLTRRAWRVKTELSGEGGWDIEIGDPEPASIRHSNELIKESSSQPIVTRRITKTNLEWRIRNLPYPLDVYSVTADQIKKSIVVRTSNKKYYKELYVPDLERVNLLPVQGNIAFAHKFNTLIITYQKPNEVLDLEKAVFEEVKNIKCKSSGEVGDCRPS